MNDYDIRWVQRFNHFARALSQLEEAVDLRHQRSLSKLEEQGLIQAFEYTYELAWNTLKDYFETQGETDIYGSRDTFRLAFRRGLVKDGDTWMEMIHSRMLTTHTYNEETARKIAIAVSQNYCPMFKELRDLLQTLKESDR
jgi:nucleotidyltransferase substrate binding protein (TIGR01987 family)